VPLPPPHAAAMLHCSATSGNRRDAMARTLRPRRRRCQERFCGGAAKIALAAGRGAP
jgi:hypothetical protein